MPIDILMPALSPTMEEGALAKWLVKVGDVVKSGDVIAEIETDKATMEVEAVDEGEVLELLVPEGAQGVKVNSVIARIAGEGAAPGAPAERSDSVIPAEHSESRDLAQKELPQGPGSAAPPPSGMTDRGAPTRLLASPLAKRLAAAASLDLAAVTGSGPNGRIVKRDIEAAIAAGPEARPQAARAPEQARTPAPVVIEGEARVIPLDGMRRTIAKRMTEAFRDIPHFPLTIDLEIDALLALRKDINEGLADEGVKISVNDLVIKAVARACARVPEANASYTPEGLVLHPHAHIAVAVAVPGGLVTPVIRAAQTKPLSAISTEMAALAEKAKARKLMPEDYSGGTFSLSNLGMMGIKSFASIINEPQGCILSVGAGEQRPVVKDGALAIATVMTVTLTCDHRVVDGAVGAAWLKAFKGFIEKPATMLV
jgi:pyruvate dehydrogenase E2 component (dihydrolipoamide acetyltransferase)